MRDLRLHQELIEQDLQQQHEARQRERASKLSSAEVAELLQRSAEGLPYLRRQLRNVFGPPRRIMRYR
jgi:hypothetical protein